MLHKRSFSEAAGWLQATSVGPLSLLLAHQYGCQQMHDKMDISAGKGFSAKYRIDTKSRVAAAQVVATTKVSTTDVASQAEVTATKGFPAKKNRTTRT